MKPIITERKTFDKEDFRQAPLAKGEYEHCVFNNCNFSDADLSDVFFLECEFRGCNLSMAKLVKTTLRAIKFKDCKMLGLHFDSCNQFGFTIHIDGCSLNHASFYQAKLKNTIFKKSSFHEADFAQSDLTNTVFDNCDLAMATFDNTILENADLRTAVNYSIDPTINKIKKTKFSRSGIAGLLDKYDIEIDPYS